jgi:hypothetical protein
MSLDEFRIPHLVGYVRRMLPEIGFDEVSKQMDCHSISAGFTPERIREMFVSILSQERESLIHPSIESIQSMRESRRSFRQKIKCFADESEEELRPLYAQNRAIRKRYHDLASVEFNQTWTNKREKTRTDSVSNRNQEMISGKMESVEMISQAARDLSALLENVRNGVSELGAIHRKSLMEFGWAMQAVERSVDPAAEESKKELRELRETTTGYREGLRELMVQLNLGGRNDDTGADRQLIHKAIRRKAEKMLPGIVSRSSELDGIGLRIQAEIDRRGGEVEEKYLRGLRKQKETMKKLERALKAAEERLAGLLSSDGVVNPGLLHLVEESRRSMDATRERTDLLMRKLQESSSSAILSDSGF